MYVLQSLYSTAELESVHVYYGILLSGKNVWPSLVLGYNIEKESAINSIESSYSI